MREYFAKHPEVAVAFSGGVDSAYLLYAASKYAHRVKAYYVLTPFQTAQEARLAKSMAATLQIPMETIPLDTLSVDAIRANSRSRCYHCKYHMFSAIRNAARRDGFSLVVEGTNASDDTADRPGYRALQELDIHSPLRELGLTKKEIRRRAEEANLPVWNAPANACLATRIPTGTPISPADLQRTEKAESLLTALGFSNHRVRLLHNCARIQAPPNQLPLLLAHRGRILEELSPLYSAILLDLEVRND